MMFCPLHRAPVLHGEGAKCATCERKGLIVVECELDKINRVVDGYPTGYHPDLHQSHAVIVFSKDEGHWVKGGAS